MLKNVFKDKPLSEFINVHVCLLTSTVQSMRRKELTAATRNSMVTSGVLTQRLSVSTAREATPRFPRAFRDISTIW